MAVRGEKQMGKEKDWQGGLRCSMKGQASDTLWRKGSEEEIKGVRSQVNEAGLEGGGSGKRETGYEEEGSLRNQPKKPEGERGVSAGRTELHGDVRLCCGREGDQMWGE